MPVGTEDRRVRKTKKAIRNAFAALLATQDINQITVKEIADKADINRKTFYNYYRGIHEVMDEIENSLVQAFDESLYQTATLIDLRDPAPVFQRLTQLLQDDQELYGCLLCMTGNSSLKEKLFSTLKAHALDSLQLHLTLSEEETEILAHYIFAGLMSVYQYWFRSNRQMPIEDLTQLVSRLSFYGVTAVLAPDLVAQN